MKYVWLGCVRVASSFTLPSDRHAMFSHIGDAVIVVFTARSAIEARAFYAHIGDAVVVVSTSRSAIDACASYAHNKPHVAALSGVR